MSILYSLQMILLYATSILSFLNNKHKTPIEQIIILPVNSLLIKKLESKKTIKFKGATFAIKNLTELDVEETREKIVKSMGTKIFAYEIEMEGKTNIIKNDPAEDESATSASHKVYVLEKIGCRCCQFVEEMGKRGKKINEIFASKDTLAALQKAAHPGKNRTWNINDE